MTFSLQCPFTWFSALLQSDPLVRPQHHHQSSTSQPHAAFFASVRSSWTCSWCGTGQHTWRITVSRPPNTWGWTRPLPWLCWRSECLWWVSTCRGSEHVHFFPFETKLDVTCLTTSLDEAPHTPPFVIWTQQTHNIMHVLQLLPRLLHFLQVWLLQFSSVSRLPSPLLFWCYFLSTWSLSSLGDTSSQLCWWPASAAWWGDFKRTKCPKCLLSVHLTH